MALVQFKVATLAAFQAAQKDENVIYFVEDARKIYKGDTPYGGVAFESVATVPAQGTVGTVYNETSTGQLKMWNGAAYDTLVATATTIGAAGSASDAKVATEKAVRDAIEAVNADADALAQRVTAVEGKASDNADAIDVLNGNGDGSVAKAVADAKTALQAEIDKKANTADLASVATSGKAADVSVADAAGKLDATNVEEALAEIIGKLEDAEEAGQVVVEKRATADSADVATYDVKQNGKVVGTINIPKDLVATAGEIVYEDADGKAGTFIKLTVANGTPFYIDVASLIEYNSVADTDEIALAQSETHEISATIKAVNGSKLVDGSVAKTKLDAAVQKSLEAADIAVPNTTKVNGHALTGDVTVTATDLGLGNVEDGAQINQKAFSNVKVGSTTIAATAETDTVEIAAGANVTVAADGKKVTVGVTGVETEGKAQELINALDYTDAAVAGQYVSAVSQENGLISVTHAQLPDYSKTYDAYGAADQALTDAKAYTDAALTWGTL